MNRAPDTRRQRNRRRLVFVVTMTLVVVGSLFARPAEPLAASAGVLRAALPLKVTIPVQRPEMGAAGPKAPAGTHERAA